MLEISRDPGRGIVALVTAPSADQGAALVGAGVEAEEIKEHRPAMAAAAKVRAETAEEVRMAKLVVPEVLRVTKRPPQPQ